MSVAFQAVVLLAIAMPGIIFRRCYSRAGQFREKRPITDELVGGFVAAAMLHWVWITLFQQIAIFFDARISLPAALMFAMGQFGKDDRNFDFAIRSVTVPPVPTFVLCYFVTLYLVSAFAGQKCREWTQTTASQAPYAKFIRWLHSLEDEGPSLRKWEEWRAHLSPPAGMSTVQFLAAVVPLGGTPFLYYGILDDVIFDDSGIPDRFILRDARRRKIGDNEGSSIAQQEPFYKIKGDLLIIRLAEATTLNLSWFGFDLDVEEVSQSNVSDASSAPNAPTT